MVMVFNAKLTRQTTKYETMKKGWAGTSDRPQASSDEFVVFDVMLAFKAVLRMSAVIVVIKLQKIDTNYITTICSLPPL